MTFVSLASPDYHDHMPPRIHVTSSQLRQGVGHIVTLLLQGHELTLTNHGAPVGVIRPWTQADAAEEDGPPPPTPPERKQKGDQPWRDGSAYPTRHLKPTFSEPEK